MLQRHLVLFLAAGALALSACATKPKAPGGGPGVAAPAAQVETPDDGWGGGGADEARISPLQEAFAAQAGDRVFFDLDSPMLTAEGRETLTRQAAWLLQHPGVRVLVAGNCDERGTREYNFALGVRRAAAGRAFLVSQGVPGSLLSTVSYGKEKPLDGRSDEAAWARNRNAQSILIDLGPR